MEQSLGNGGVPEMFVVKIDFPQQVMIEKWFLVLLIIGCTSLVFLICFPIDFYLYRRRKRIARERKNLTMYRPQTPTRAAQVHAKVTITTVAAEIDIEEMNKEEQRRYRAERRIEKFLTMFKKRAHTAQKETLKFEERLTEIKSEKRQYVEATPDTSESLENKDEQTVNVYHVTNDEFINSVPQGVNQLPGSFNKSNKKLNKSDGGSQRITAGKFSNASAIWSDDEDVVKYEKKHLKYGAREPLENMTNIVNETTDKPCFTIPIKNRNLVYVEPETSVHDSYADIEIHDTNTGTSQTGVILENTTKSFPDAICEDVTTFVSTRDDISKIANTDAITTDFQSDTKLFQTVFNTGRDKSVKSYKILTHSQSDQCISESFKLSKVSSRSGRKRNIVSPTDKNTFTFSDPLHNEDSLIMKQRALRLSTPLEEQYIVPEIKKKKRKRKSYLTNKQSSTSMPELIYEKEKY